MALRPISQSDGAPKRGAIECAAGAAYSAATAVAYTQVVMALVLLCGALLVLHNADADARAAASMAAPDR